MFLIGKDEVTSSNLVISSRKIQYLCGFQDLRAAYIFYHLKKYRQKYRHLKSTYDCSGYSSGIAATFFRYDSFFNRFRTVSPALRMLSSFAWVYILSVIAVSE